MSLPFEIRRATSLVMRATLSQSRDLFGGLLGAIFNDNREIVLIMA